MGSSTHPPAGINSQEWFPTWGHRDSPIVLDMRGSPVNLTDSIRANEFVPQSTSTAWPGMRCPEYYSLSEFPLMHVLVEPEQTTYYGCECISPWVQPSAATDSSFQQCTLVPEQVHVLTNPILPLPNAGQLIYDPDHVWLSFALFSFTALVASVALLCTILLQVYRIQGLLRAKGKISSTLPGVLTDVLGKSQVDHSKDPPSENVTVLQCAPQAITLVAIRLDPLDYTGSRRPPPAETAKAYMEVCQVRASNASLVAFTARVYKM